MLYTYADADVINPVTERGKRLLALAVKHDIYTPTGHNDGTYWHNRVKFSELVSFAAELMYIEKAFEEQQRKEANSGNMDSPHPKGA